MILNLEYSLKLELMLFLNNLNPKAQIERFKNYNTYNNYRKYIKCKTQLSQ